MPIVYIIGDSLAATKLESKKPETGWGEMMHHFLPDNYQIENHAINGRSTKSFIAEGRLDVIKENIKKGDLLLIQFGHNDQKKEDPLRFTEPFSDYQANLSQMIQVALSKQAKPILITPVSRRSFVYDNVLDGYTLGDYPDSMRMVSKMHHIPLIDIYEVTQALISSLGDEGSKRLFLHLDENTHPNYPNGIKDNTHLSKEGAELIASLIALELKRYL